MSAITRKKVWLIIVEESPGKWVRTGPGKWVRTGPGKWVRTGPVYRQRLTAESWLSFVSDAKRKAAKIRAVSVTLVDGKPTPEAVEWFSREFNIDLEVTS